MKKITRTLWYAMAVSAAAGLPVLAAPPAPPPFQWQTVVNNTDLMPDAPLNRTFNSYNQPSVNVRGLVVMRARSVGGGGQPATHGIYTRDMSAPGNSIVRILDRTTEVPQPNNLGTTFVETPSFPRIDMTSDTIATRGNHQPVWTYTPPGETETRAGTTGIYTNPFGSLTIGASKLGTVPDFGFFAVPGLDTPTMFDVFPGAPSVTMGSTLVFKGNYTVNGVGKTGVFFRQLKNKPIPSSGGPLSPAGGTQPAVLIANNTDTKIPGTNQVFGSTSPPSAAGSKVVFSGFDDENNPTLGGIYLASLTPTPPLRKLAGIGNRVPGQPHSDTFNNLGEGGAFDGRYVGFWGSWGAETKTVHLYCPTEGNKDRIDYCNRALYCKEDGRLEEDTNSTCEGEGDARRCWQVKQIPVNQGIFIHDTSSGSTRAVAKTGDSYNDFLFWNYSGKTPCTSAGGHGEEGAEDDGEPARWRSSAFVAVSQNYTAFKAATEGGVGIYLDRGPVRGITPVLETNSDGQLVDAEAPAGSKVTEVGLEREGLRGNWLAINAKMEVEGGTEEDGMAGVYITTVPR